MWPMFGTEAVHNVHAQRNARRPSQILYWTLTGSIFLNLFLGYRLSHYHPRVTPGITKDVSKFAGLSYDTPVMYHNHTDFQSQNEAIREKTWASLDTSPIQIILDDATAQQYGLELTLFRFPWDEDQGVYFLKAFHDLHCLKSLRHVFEDLSASKNTPKMRHHFYHCLDSLRQSIMCHADDTPMTMHDLPDKFGDKQVRMCRNFDALVEWTQQPDRHACYHRFGDHGRIKHWLEQFAFCRDDSPYLEIQQAYFEKWGHKPDMYDLEDEHSHAGYM